jgi:hypothetical protein
MAILVPLLSVAARLLLGVALAFAVAVVVALLRSDSSFSQSLGIAMLGIGGISLLMAAGGDNSPSRRAGTIDPWLASFAPTLWSRQAERYAGTTLSTSAVFALVGLVLVAAGFLLV